MLVQRENCLRPRLTGKTQGAESRSQKTGIAKYHRCRERGGGNEFAHVVLRCDLFAALIPSLDEAFGVRCQPDSLAQAGRETGGYGFSASPPDRQGGGGAE